MDPSTFAYKVYGIVLKACLNPGFQWQMKIKKVKRHPGGDEESACCGLGDRSKV